MHSHTYTVVELEVSAAAYEEIAAKLRAAQYHHVFGRNGQIDMSGIALTRLAPLPNAKPVTTTTDPAWGTCDDTGARRTT